MDKQVVISVKTILITLLIGLCAYILYRLGPVFGIILVATLIVVSVEPVIAFLMKKRLFKKPVGRGPAVIITYVLLIIILGVVLTLGLPPVIIQARKLLVLFSDFFQQLNVPTKFDDVLSQLYTSLANVSGNVISMTFSVFSSLATVFSVLIISIYMSLDWENIKERLISFFPPKMQEDSEDIVKDIELNISNWVKGQLILMLVIGFFSLLGLIILDVKYPLALALIAGLLEIVPILGPILSAILAGIVGFADAPFKGVGVIVLFIIIQQLENNILVPKIMQKVSGFSPLIIMLALLIGSEFFGVVGAVLAVPMTMIGTIILKKVLKYSR